MGSREKDEAVCEVFGEECKREFCAAFTEYGCDSFGGECSHGIDEGEFDAAALCRLSRNGDEADAVVFERCSFVGCGFACAGEDPEGGMFYCLDELAFEGDGEPSVEDDADRGEGVGWGIFGEGDFVEEELWVVLSHGSCADENSVGLSDEGVSVETGLGVRDDGLLLWIVVGSFGYFSVHADGKFDGDVWKVLGASFEVWVEVLFSFGGAEVIGNGDVVL